MPYVVGLTGGIGSGKSSVANLFGDLDVPIISADQLAREVVKPGSDALAQIVKHFGEAVLEVDGTLNRARLRKQIFQNKTERAWLENLLHPLIAEERLRQIAATSKPYVIVEIPLLLEKSLGEEVDRVLVVDVPEALQIERVKQRDSVSKASIRAIMDTQVSASQRRASADDVIDNSGSLDDLRPQIESLHRKYLKLAAQAD